MVPRFKTFILACVLSLKHANIPPLIYVYPCIEIISCAHLCFCAHIYHLLNVWELVSSVNVIPCIHSRNAYITGTICRDSTLSNIHGKSVPSTHEKLILDNILLPDERTNKINHQFAETFADVGVGGYVCHPKCLIRYL